MCLFTGELAIEAAERYAEGLQCTQRIAEVHREDILHHTAKLHHYVVHYKQRKQHTHARVNVNVIMITYLALLYGTNYF